MVSLLNVVDLLALQGSMEARQISLQLNAPLPLINAMLQRLEAMGRARHHTESVSECLSGSCKGCADGVSACQRELWQLC